MRCVLQRVSQAEVKIAGDVVGRIEVGLVALLGVAAGDTQRDVDYLVEKVLGLRVFEDAQGKMNLSLLDVGGGLLVVSQFTLLGDCRKGKRPSFDAAAPPEDAVRLYEAFVDAARRKSVPVSTGRFREHMRVSLVNDGPVTILLDSKKAF